MSDYDYTNPIENPDDDFMMPNVGVASDQTAAQVLEDAQIPPIPKGKYECFIKSCSVPKSEDGSYKLTKFESAIQDADGAFTDDAPYFTYEVQCILALVSDPKRTAFLSFRLPPPGANPEDPGDREMNSYLYGASVKKYDAATKQHVAKPIDERKSNNSFFYKSLRTFLYVLGLGEGENGTLPQASLRDWRTWPDGSNRTFLCSFDNPRDGKYSNPKAMSYEFSDDTKARLAELTAAPARPTAPQQAARPAAPQRPAAPARPAPPANRPAPPAGRPTPPQRPAAPAARAL